jgi:hypothetical protein
MPDEYAVWQLPADAPFPQTDLVDFLSFTRTADELSIVSPTSAVSAGAPAETGWRCLQVVGPLSFELTGILAALSEPLARSGIPVFVVSTFDTDYLLVRSHDLERTISTLSKDGHTIETPMASPTVPGTAENGTGKWK